MSRTRKPCPACQQVISSRSANEICYGCADLIRFAKETQAARAEANPDVLEYDLPARGWDHVIDIKCRSYGDERNAMQKAFCDLARALSYPEQPAERAIDPGLNSNLYPKVGGCWPQWQNVYLTKRQADAIRSLLKTVEDATNAAFIEGQEDGTSFIANIAKGECSISDINEYELSRVKRRKKAA